MNALHSKNTIGESIPSHKKNEELFEELLEQDIMLVILPTRQARFEKRPDEVGRTDSLEYYPYHQLSFILWRTASS